MKENESLYEHLADSACSAEVSEAATADSC